MDSSSFDRLARTVAGSASRRTALAGLAVALSRLLPGTAAAQPRTTCRELGKVCVPERNIDCCAGTTCRNGRCRCGEGRRRCQGACVSVRRCCEGQCPGGAVCRDGRCVCPAGSRRCGERCVSRQRCCPGQKKCGERCIRQAACCGGCPATQVCRNGRCGCAAGTKPCNGRCIANDACCGGCGPNQLCHSGTCVAKVCGNGGPCLAFITSARPSANFGGIAGGDQLCQTLASEAGRPGTYLAWLSDDEHSPATRFMRSPGPYVRVDGRQLAANWAALTSTGLEVPLNITQENNPVAATQVWTGTSPQGTWMGTVVDPQIADCAGWTTGSIDTEGVYGRTDLDGPNWTSADHFDCRFFRPIYCFQQGEG